MNNYIPSDVIKKFALQAGFDACGICEPVVDEQHKNYYNSWLKHHFQGNKKYLEDTRRRFNPGILLPEIKSVVMVLLSYNTHQTQHPEAFYRFSKYAYGEDYHSVIGQKLTLLEHLLTQEYTFLKTYSFVDSSPVWEKYWAKKSGLGWHGKHTITINKQFGSFFFLGGVFINAETTYDDESVDHCGDCELCLKACPAEALATPRMLDVRKCISALTIESRDELPKELQQKFGNIIYGCDICQDVCPYNKNISQSEHFIPNKKLLDLTKQDWETLTEQEFEELFSGSAVHRLGYKRLKRNVDFAKTSGNTLE